MAEALAHLRARGYGEPQCMHMLILGGGTGHYEDGGGGREDGRADGWRGLGGQGCVMDAVHTLGSS